MIGGPSFITLNGRQRWTPRSETDAVAGDDLKLTAVTEERGRDNLGRWTATVLTYSLTGVGPIMEIVFRVYRRRSNVILFGQVLTTVCCIMTVVS